MKNKEWWFGLGAVLVLVGVVLQILQWSFAPYIFSVGAIFVFVLRLISPIKNESNDFRVKRLIRMQFISSCLLIVGAYFMFAKQNTWALSLFIAAFLDLFIAFRLPKKEN